MQALEGWVMDVKEQAYLSIQDDDVTEDNFDDMIDLPCQDILDAKVENISNTELNRLIANYGVEGAKALLYVVMENQLERLITYEDYQQWRQSRNRNE